MTYLPIGNQIQVGRKVASIDAKYGPYESLQDAFEALGSNGMDVIAPGLTVGIVEDGKIVEYWWQGGVTLAHLVKKANPGHIVDLKTATRYSTIPHIVSECVFAYDGEAVNTVSCMYGGANCTLVHANVLSESHEVDKLYLIAGRTIIEVWNYEDRPSWTNRYLTTAIAEKVDDLYERLKWK